MIGFLIICLVNAVALWLISKLPFGVEIDSPWKALISGLVIGLLNIFVAPIIKILGIPLAIVTLGVFYLFVPVIVFGLAAWMIEGFRLRYGILSAILGAIALSIVNSLLFPLVAPLLPPPR